MTTGCALEEERRDVGRAQQGETRQLMNERRHGFVVGIDPADRFAAFVALPAEVTREGVLAKDRRMLDLCWNALNLENAEWWREWKRAWQP